MKQFLLECNDLVLGRQQISDRKLTKPRNGVIKLSKPCDQSRSQRRVVTWVWKCHRTPENNPRFWLGSFCLSALHTGTETGSNLFACCFRNVCHNQGTQKSRFPAAFCTPCLPLTSLQLQVRSLRSRHTLVTTLFDLLLHGSGKAQFVWKGFVKVWSDGAVKSYYY